jgi:non-homologous end joining protein Ku
MEYVLKMKFRQAYKLITKAVEERNTEAIFKVYLVDRQHQLYLLANGAIKSHDILSFPQYLERTAVQRSKLDDRSTDEIMEEIMKFNFERGE